MKLKQRMFLLIIISASFILMAGFLPSRSCQYLSGIACAAEVSLAWDANSENNLAGYKLYYESEEEDDFYGGTDANEGESPITIYLLSLKDPDSPTYTISGLEKGVYYYFSLTAFDSDGMESDFSDEVGVMTVEDGGDSGGGACFLTSGLGYRSEFWWIIAVMVLLLGVGILRFPVEFGCACGKKTY